MASRELSIKMTRLTHESVAKAANANLLIISLVVLQKEISIVASQCLASWRTVDNNLSQSTLSICHSIFVSVNSFASLPAAA